MRLVSFYRDDTLVPGLLRDDLVIDITVLSRLASWPEDRTRRASSVRGLLESGLPTLGELDRIASERLDDVSAAGGARPFSSTRLGPPIPDPGKIICTGLNYVDHAKEVGAPVPAVPLFFPKYANSLIGPTDTIIPPVDDTETVDYEAELAIVIGETCRYVSEDRAAEHIAGAMVFNDVSARTLQLATQTWTGGKAVDTFGPCGPALVLRDGIGDLGDLGVKTWVDGRLVQDGHTSQMIFGPAYLVSFLSRVMTLEPGDIIATGTPAGVGKSHDPPVFLKDGSRVDVEIDGLGRLENPIGRPVLQ